MSPLSNEDTRQQENLDRDRQQQDTARQAEELQQAIAQSRADDTDQEIRRDSEPSSPPAKDEATGQDNPDQKEYDRWRGSYAGGKELPKSEEQYTREVLPNVHIPKDATIKERDATGKPTVFVKDNEEYFAKGSTPYEHGFRTLSEYNEAQRSGLHRFGVHPGADVPDESVIVYGHDGKPMARLTGNQINEGSVPAQIASAHPEMTKIAVKNLGEMGGERHYTPEEFAKMPKIDWQKAHQGKAWADATRGLNKYLTYAEDDKTPSLDIGKIFQDGVPYSKIAKLGITEREYNEAVSEYFIANKTGLIFSALESMKGPAWDTLKASGVYTGLAVMDLLNRKGMKTMTEYVNSIKATGEGKVLAVPKLIADHTVPFWRTYKHWDEMTPGWRAINLAIDTAIVAPHVYFGIKAIKTAINPRVEATKALLSSEGKYASKMAGELQKTYGKEVSQSFKDVQSAQKDYALTYARYQDLAAKGKASESLLDKVTSTRQGLTDALMKYRGKLEGVTPSESGLTSAYTTVRSIMKDMPADVPKNWERIIDTFGGQKGNIKALEAQVSALETRFEAVKAKFPLEPNKWVDIYADLENSRALLNATKGMSINQLLAAIDKTKDPAKLATLKDQLTELVKSGLSRDIRVKTTTLADGTIRYEAISDNPVNMSYAVTTKPVSEYTEAELARLNALLKQAGGSQGLTTKIAIPMVSKSGGGGSTSHELRSPRTIELAPVIANITIPVPDRNGEIREVPLSSPLVSPGIKTEMAEIVDNATEKANDLNNKNVPANEIQNQVSAQISKAVNSATNTEVKNAMATQAQVQALTKTITKTVTKTKIEPPKPPKGTPPPPFITLPKLQGEASGPEGDFTGAITLKLGALHGEPVFHTLKQPYKKQSDLVTTVGVIPPGSTLITGKGSAQKTARLITGKHGPARVDLDVGFQDLRITSRGRNVKLDFTPDPFSRTRHPIHVGRPGRGNGLVSRKKGKIFHTKVRGNTLLSRHPLGRRRAR